MSTPKTCKVRDCGRPVHARSMCRPHDRGGIALAAYRPVQRPGVQEARERLWDALETALQVGKRVVPCLGPDRDFWTSENVEELAEAAAACRPCPALLECSLYADVAQEHDVVYGGVIRGTRRSQLRAARRTA